LNGAGAAFCTFLSLQIFSELFICFDKDNNRIGQWTNVSHGLNPEAQTGMFTLKAFIADREISQVFEVNKFGKLLCKGSSM